MKLIQTALEIVALKAPERSRYSEWHVSQSIVVLLGCTLGYYYVTPQIFENAYFDVLCVFVLALLGIWAFEYAQRRYSSTVPEQRFSPSESLNILAAGTLVWSLMDVLSQWYYGYMETIINRWLVAAYVLAAAYMFYAYYKAVKVATGATRKMVVTAIAVAMALSILAALIVIGGANILTEYAGVRMVPPDCGIQTLQDGTVVDTCDGTVQKVPKEIQQ